MEQITMTNRMLPIGIQTFSKLRNMGCVYVDKTALVYKMTHEGGTYFLSRPRRFGKSLLISTLEDYFTGQKELFKGLAIEKLEKLWYAHPVFRFDLSLSMYDKKESLWNLLDDYLKTYEKEFCLSGENPDIAVRFRKLLETAYKKTGLGCVVLVDEYDKPLLETYENEELNMHYRQVFKSFFGVLKGYDRYMRFAFFTGITKFRNVSIFSDLNQLQNISLSPVYSTLCGITQQELESVFAPEIKQMAEYNKITVAQCIEKLRQKYNGYHFAQDLTDVYNPFGLLNAFSQKLFSSYWMDQATPKILINRLKNNDWNIIDYSGNTEIDAFVLDDTPLGSKDPTSLLYQSGYLTIKSFYDDTYILGYPNKEVETGFTKEIVPQYITCSINDMSCELSNICRYLEAADIESFFKTINSLYAYLPYPEGNVKNNFIERDFRNVLYITFLLLGNTRTRVQCEWHFFGGRSDMVILTKDYIYIFEFKMNTSTDVALKQIEDKGYAAPFLNDKRKLFKIGAVFSSESRNIKDYKLIPQPQAGSSRTD